ncbi:hypothetical protein GCM10027026_37650 [Myroides odoratimimus subsp. xuanwuensis]
MAMLASATSVSFPFLREQLGISDSDLSKQMAALEKAGYLKISKTGRGRGATTTYRITRSGHSAYQRHAAALREILAESAALSPEPPSPA